MDSCANMLEIYDSFMDYVIGSVWSLLRIVGMSGMDEILKFGSWKILHSPTFPKNSRIYQVFLTFPPMLSYNLNIPLSHTRILDHNTKTNKLIFWTRFLYKLTSCCWLMISRGNFLCLWFLRSLSLPMAMKSKLWRLINYVGNDDLTAA